MATTVARVKLDEMNITGEINERLPAVTNGMIAHYPLDGGLAGFKDISGAKVLGYRYNTTSCPWYSWFVSNGAVVTETTDLTAITIAQAKQYDLILADCYVWGVSSSIMNALKTFVDAGVSCLAVGNDTRTNCFVSAYSGSTTATHNVEIEQNLPFDPGGYLFTYGSGDVTGGIDTLYTPAYPVYRRADTKQITGYIYEGPLGAALYFDQEGFGMNDFQVRAFKYVLGKSIGNIVNTDVVFLPDTIGIEEATTNIFAQAFADPDFENTSFTNSAWKVAVVNDPDARNGKCVEITAITDKVDWCGAINMTTTPIAANTTYTTTIRYKVINCVDNTAGTYAHGNLGLWSHGLNSSGASVDYPDIVFWTSGGNGSNSNGWKTYTHVYTSASTVTQRTWSLGTGSVKAGTTYRIDYIQSEQKAYATSFTPTSRNAGNLQIPFTLKPPYTINFFHRSFKLKSTIVNQDSSPMILHIGSSYYSNASLCLWHYNSSNLSVYIKGNTNSGWTGSASNLYTYTSGNWDNIEHMYTVIAASSTSFKFYVDGVYKATVTSSEAVDNIVGSVLTLGNIYMPDALYRDLSIYNRALSDTEVTKLYTTTLSIGSSGSMPDTKVVERPLYIPSDAVYFPLDSDTSDTLHQYSASDTTNLVYQDSAAWVGTATSNLLPSNAYSILYAYNATDGFNSTAVQVSDGSWRLARVNPATGKANSEMLCNLSFGVTAGTTYTESFCYKHDGTNISFYITFFTNNGHHAITPTVVNLGGGWYRAYATYTIEAGGTWLRALDLNSISGDFNYLYIRDAQVESKPFATPPLGLAGSRGYASLEYNLNSILGLDWNGDWSIVYWKMPLGTSTNDLVGYSLESLGCNSNSVGGGYIWWGKPSGSNTLSSCTPSAITPVDYFNHWHRVSLVKSGGTVTITSWPISGQAYVRTASYGTIASNYFVTQYGYDLKLGGWDDTGVVNAFYRDLVVAKRAFTTAELAAMATPFSSSMTTKILQVPNLIKESTSIV